MDITAHTVARAVTFVGIITAVVHAITDLIRSDTAATISNTRNFTTITVTADRCYKAPSSVKLESSCSLTKNTRLLFFMTNVLTLTRTRTRLNTEQYEVDVTTEEADSTGEVMHIGW